MNHADKGNVAVYISMHIGTVNYASTGLGTLFFKSGVIQSVFCFWFLPVFKNQTIFVCCWPVKSFPIILFDIFSMQWKKKKKYLQLV